MIKTDFAVTRKAPRKKAIRAFQGEMASHVISDAGFGKGIEMIGLTKGQFSFVDLIEAVLHKTGPADVIVSTWAASVADLGRLTLFCDDGMIRNARFLLDGAFESYNKATALGLRERFGDENIRIIPNHAKFAMIGNDEWRVVIQTSMNLNHNRRIESFNLTEGAELYEFFGELVADVFSVQKPSEGFGAGGYRASSKTLGQLGEGRTSAFFDVKAGTALL